MKEVYTGTYTEVVTESTTETFRKLIGNLLPTDRQLAETFHEKLTDSLGQRPKGVSDLG